MCVQWQIEGCSKELHDPELKMDPFLPSKKLEGVKGVRVSRFQFQRDRRTKCWFTPFHPCIELYVVVVV